MRKGDKHTPEAIEKMRLSRIGKTAGENHPMWGKHHTLGAIEKNRLAHLGKKTSEEVRKKMSDSHKGKMPKNIKMIAGWNKGKKFSKETIRKLILSHLGQKTGAENCNWKGGISKLHKTERQLAMETHSYKEWRRKVFERDNYTCQICGVRGGNLHADHIKAWSVFIDLRYDLENGRTLCFDCHKQTETYGYTKLLKEQGELYGAI